MAGRPHDEVPYFMLPMTDPRVSFPETEGLRLAALEELALLDTPCDVEYGQLVELAAEICGTPISSFTLIGKERAWMHAAVGVGEMFELPRHLTFCSHAIQQDDLFVIEDTARDERFQQHTLVIGEPHIRFYAGMPLGGTRGAHLGTLCVADTVPRQMTASQRNALKILALQVEGRMKQRIQERQLRQAVLDKEALVAELRSKEDLFRTFMDSIPCLSFMKDAQGRFVYYNKKMADEFRISADEWMGKSVHDLFPVELAERFRETDLKAMGKGIVVERKEETLDHSGAVKHWKTYKFPWKNQRGEQMLGGVSVDVTMEMVQQEVLERLATIDTLTGLLNRRALDEGLQREIHMARRTGVPLSLVLFDIDDFKKRNDMFGHAVGDEVLALLGRLIQSEARVTDLTARYGGEEFVAMLPGADEHGALLFAERLRSAMAREAWPGGPVTASFGTASLGVETSSGGDLISVADLALYAAKRAGKDRVVSFYSPAK